MQKKHTQKTTTQLFQGCVAVHLEHSGDNCIEISDKKEIYLYTRKKIYFIDCKDAEDGLERLKGWMSIAVCKNWGTPRNTSISEGNTFLVNEEIHRGRWNMIMVGCKNWCSLWNIFLL